MGKKTVEESKNVNWNNNKFALIRVLADRVRQLELGAPPMLERRGRTLMETALEEFSSGKILISHLAPAVGAIPKKSEKE